MIQLSNGTTTITLPPDLQWEDEFDWSAVEQEKDYSLTGALIIQQGTKKKGRPITLISGGGAWAKRSIVLTIQTFYNTAEQTLTLTLWGAEYAVMFDRPDGFKAREVSRIANPGVNEWYTITLKLFEVESA